MEELSHFWLLAFSSFFTLINPLGVMPVFLSLTAELSAKERLQVATKSIIVAFLVILFFALTGQFIFRFFNISIHSLRVVGGVIFFVIGMDMLQARISKVEVKDTEIKKKYMKDISITPMAIPILCGPGAITNAIILMEDAVNYRQQITLLVAVIAVMSITYIGLIGSSRIIRFIGETLNTVLMRLMGLIIMVIAVEYFFAGIKPLMAR
jgi:multiple antibiotic resistance protein